MNLDVVVVTYESAEHLKDCLLSVPPGATAYVVDNNSSDDSDVVAQRHGAVVTRNSRNLGFAAAANQGAAMGASDLILFLNPDAQIALPDLERLITALTSEPSVAVAGPRLVHPDGTEQRSWWPFPSARRSWYEALGLHRLMWHRQRQNVPFVVGACLLMRRSAFVALGGFDESFWLYGEEADLCRRASFAGWDVRYVHDAVAIHVGGASADAAGASLVREHFLLGADRFIAKHGGRGAVASHRIAMILGSMIRLLVVRPGHPTSRYRRYVVRRQAHALMAHLEGPQTSTTICPGRVDVVVCSLEPWDDTWRRNQFLVRELMTSDPAMRVLFVEPPADILHETLRSHHRPGGLGLRQLTDDGRLWALRPRKVMPRLAGGWADRSLVRQLQSAAATLGMPRPTLWVNDSIYAPLVKDSGWPSLYDITDDWLEANCSRRERRRRQRREDRMLSGAGVVTVCSPTLAQRRGRARHVRFIPNAVDVPHFTKAQSRPIDLPPGPAAVYVGTLHDERLDVSLVIALARSLPDAQIVLVGPDALSGASRSQLTAETNIALLGARPYETIPGYFQHADVVIVPHLVSTFTDSLDPIKAYEIMAVGRPSVVTPAAGLRDLGPSSICVGRRGFVAAVQQVLDDRPGSAPRSVPSWADRAAMFSSALEDARVAPAILSVVYVDHCALLSGGELALLNLIPSLVGIKAYVILAEDGPLRIRLQDAGIECEILYMPGRTRKLRRSNVSPRRLPAGAIVGTLSYVLRLRRRLRVLQPDLLHTNSLKAGVYGCLAARMAGIPSVWHVRDRIDASYLPRSAVKLIQILIRYLPSLAIANSYATLDTLASTRRATVVASPVVYDAIASIGPTSAGLEAAPFVVGMVGRISPWKGQDVFLRAFAQAFPSGPEVATIVGGPLFDEEDFELRLHLLVEELGLAGRVEFTGFHPNVGELLPGFSVLVHASVIPEPFGQVILEAMAAGVPVIAAGAGGPLEIVGEYECALLYPPGDVDALAASLNVLRLDEAMRIRLSANGRVRAQHFTPDVVAGQMVEIYKLVLAHRTDAIPHEAR